MPNRLATRAASLFFLLCLALFLGGQAYIAGINGWWLDELFALFVSDPAQPFREIFRDRIFPDTNLPSYFSALWLVRAVISGDRAAGLLLNGLGLAAGLGIVLATSHRRGLLVPALLAAGAFLLSGSVARYFAEQRVYLWALASAFATAWLCAIAIEQPKQRPGLPVMALAGLLAGALHPFSALIAAALATAMLAAAFGFRRRDLLAPALVLGSAASLVLLGWAVAWSSLAPGEISRVSWLRFDLQNLLAAAWEIKTLAFGDQVLLLPLLGLCLAGLVDRATRPLTVTFALAMLLFILLPMLVSLRQPVISGRYWLIGTPAWIVLVSFLLHAWWRDAAAAAPAPSLRHHFWPALGTTGAVGLFAAAGLLGSAHARDLIARKGAWESATAAAPLIRDCPAGSIHTRFPPSINEEMRAAFYVYTTGASYDLFVDAADPATPPLRPAEASCPVLGVAEHVWDPDPRTAPPSLLLHMLRIEATAAEVQLLPHATGFLVVRRDASLAGAPPRRD